MPLGAPRPFATGAMLTMLSRLAQAGGVSGVRAFSEEKAESISGHIFACKSLGRSITQHLPVTIFMSELSFFPLLASNPCLLVPVATSLPNRDGGADPTRPLVTSWENF